MTVTPIDGEPGEDSLSEDLFTPPTRQRASDYVFTALARAILRGDLKPHAPLPTQRELGRRFAISPLVVRQAIHRLEDLGLVRVRQGSPTIVLDPMESSDIRLLQLETELAPPQAPEWLWVIEQTMLAGVPILELAERRIAEAELIELEALIASMPEEPTQEQFDTFDRTFWTILSRATRNRIMQIQVRWWFNLMQGQPNQLRVPVAFIPRVMLARRDVVGALRARSGAAELHLKYCRIGIGLIEAQVEQAMQQG